MDSRWRSGRLLARVLAFAALAAAAIAIVVVVAGSLDGKDEEKKRKAESTEVSGCEAEAQDAVDNGFYIVQQDDLLSVIAQRTCIPVEELQRLNPETDPQALTPGTCLKLELGGCERATQ